MSLAVDLANARGGLLGRRVRLASADDGSHEEGVTQLVNRLCDREGALVVFGEVSSVVSERAAQAAARKGVPFVATGSTAVSSLVGVPSRIVRVVGGLRATCG